MNLVSKGKSVGFAIIGAGSIAEIHGKAIQAIKGARLLGVYSRTWSSVSLFSKNYECIAYQTIDELLEVEGLDVVCVCSPSGRHAEAALKVIAAGKHCIIEKPLEVNLEKSDLIIEAAKKKGVQIAVIFPSRFYEDSKLLKDAVDSGRFGKLVLGSAYVKWSRTPEYYRSKPWRGTWEQDGGGALMNQAIHAVDMLQWCMGKVESVQAFSGNFRHMDIETEDTAVAVLKFANGALGTIECSTAVFPGALKRIEIMGTSGTAVLEDSNLVRWEFETGSLSQKEAGKEIGSSGAANGGVSDPMAISFLGHQKQIEDFLHAIETGASPLVDGLEGRKSVEIITAIYKSAETGTLIKLD